MSTNNQRMIDEAVAIVRALPDETIVRMMDEMDDDIYETSDRVADLFDTTMTPPTWYVDKSSVHPHTGRHYYGPMDDDLYMMLTILEWLHNKGIIKPAELLLGLMGWDANQKMEAWSKNPEYPN